MQTKPKVYQSSNSIGRYASSIFIISLLTVQQKKKKLDVRLTGTWGAKLVRKLQSLQ